MQVTTDSETSEATTQPNTAIAAWVAQQLVDTHRRLRSPLLTPGRRARLERRATDLQKLLEVARG